MSLIVRAGCVVGASSIQVHDILHCNVVTDRSSRAISQVAYAADEESIVMSDTKNKMESGVDAAAAPAASAWRGLIARAAIGMLALLGLSGIGALSMVAGLDGAHASLPTASSVWTPVSSPAGAAGATSTSATPSSNVPDSSTPASSAEATACPAHTEDGRVILNLAGVDELRKIPGIGPKRAQAIIALRTKLKRFKRGSDLLRVRGIGPKSLTRMQSHFVVDPPAGHCPNATAPLTK
jgi:competence protein ComEA